MLFFSNLVDMFKAKLALRPNCLLTRRPLLFLTPTRSVFFYKQVWLPTTHLLTEHGYKASEFQLPFQDIPLKNQYLSQMKNKLQYSHLWLDEITYQETQSFFDSFLPDSTSTLTIFTDKSNPVNRPACYNFSAQRTNPRLGYQLHTLWSQWKNLAVMPAHAYITNINIEQRDQLLDHCIQLAELDFDLD